MHQAAHIGLVESIYALTEGNPFFIEETLKSLIATDEIASKDGVWERTLLFGSHARSLSIPRSVHDAVYQRTLWQRWRVDASTSPFFGRSYTLTSPTCWC